MSLKYFFIIFLYTATIHPWSLMLDPVHMSSAGREIGDTFEQGLTMQCAKQIAQQLLEQHPKIKVIINNPDCQKIQPLHRTIFANRMNPDLYISIGFYYQKTKPFHAAIFYYRQNDAKLCQKPNPLHFYPIHQAHVINISKTDAYAKKFFESLQHNSHFICDGLFAIPCKPLFGIQSPALYLEFGIQENSNVSLACNAIIDCLQKVIS